MINIIYACCFCRCSEMSHDATLPANKCLIANRQFVAVKQSFKKDNFVCQC